MKNIYLSLLLTTITLSVYSQQVTLTLQPDASSGKDAYVTDWPTNNWVNTNFGNIADYVAIAWTSGGVPYTGRSLVDFDLSAIPAGATIVSANLTLYNNPNSTQTDGQHKSLTGSNEAWLERITSSWNEMTVTWNNQPSTTSLNSVYLPQSTSPNQNYSNIDVKNLVVDMINNPVSSYGFMIKLDTEQTYRSLVLASSDHPDANKHPKLEITYLTNCIDLKLQPNAKTGKDAYITNWPNNNWANTNFGYLHDYVAIAWTDGGLPYIGRSLIDFDLSSLPPASTIVSAHLSLYNNPNSSQVNGEHQSLTGSNAARLERIVSPWDEAIVTWNNQPITTGQNAVLLSQSTSPHQDFTNIDVTSLVLDMVNNPSNSFGFMLKLETEQTYRSLIFSSSDHADPAKHPRLEICYTLSTGIESTPTADLLNIYPNPAVNDITFYIPGSKEKEIIIIDVQGQLISKFNTNNEHIVYNTRHLAQGVYFVRYVTEEKTIIKKFVKK